MNGDLNDKLKELLHQTAQGDAKAFKALYDATSPRLNAVAQTLMRDRALAEDVLQDAFVQVWHRASEFHAERGSVTAILLEHEPFELIGTARITKQLNLDLGL